jgi:uncharacterized protein YkwD
MPGAAFKSPRPAPDTKAVHHPGGAMKTRLVRTSLLAALAFGAVLAGPVNAAWASPTTAPPRYDSVGTTRLYALVNAHRTAKGLHPLTVNARLAGIAKSWTSGMARTGNFAHNDALFSKASHRSLGMSTLGENVAFNYSVEAAHAALLNSPHHLYNIELPAFAVGGFAVVVDSTGKYWVTEDFGSAPRAVAAPAPPVRAAVVRPVAKPVRQVVAPRPVAHVAPVAKPAPKAAPKAAPKPAAVPVAHVAARPVPEADLSTVAGESSVAAAGVAAHAPTGALPWSAAGLLAAVVLGFARLRA